MMRLALLLLSGTLGFGTGTSFAGHGWYLLIPSVTPIEDVTRRPSGDPRPGPVTWQMDGDIRTWNQHAAFDSAAQCETERGRLHSDAFLAKLDAHRRADKWTPQQAAEKQKAEVRRAVLRAETSLAAIDFSICVASNDRRLR
jgi:hypothetical protein